MTITGGLARARSIAASLSIILVFGAVLIGPIDTAAAQNGPAKRTPAQGAGNAQAITAQMKNAIALTRGGKFDAGYAQLLAALDAADRLDDAQFVMEQYFEVTAALRAVKRDDLAEKLFVRAFNGKAAAQLPPGNADVLLMYAILISDHARIAEAVPALHEGDRGLQRLLGRRLRGIADRQRQARGRAVGQRLGGVGDEFGPAQF